MIAFDHPLLPPRVHRFATRLLNFARPRPRTVPLTVEQILGSAAGRELVDRFLEFYYRAGTAPSMSYLGLSILKNPCDIWVIVELMERLRPTIVVETGTHCGGSAVYYADVLRLLGVEAPVVTIDINPKWSLDPDKRGVTSLVGYSTDASIVSRVQALVADRQRARPGHVMILLDSDHSRDNVLQEMLLPGPRSGPVGGGRPVPGRERRFRAGPFVRKVPADLQPARLAEAEVRRRGSPGSPSAGTDHWSVVHLEAALVAPRFSH